MKYFQLLYLLFNSSVNPLDNNPILFHNIHELVQIVQIIEGLFASARDHLLANNNRNEDEYAMV